MKTQPKPFSKKNNESGMDATEMEKRGKRSNNRRRRDVKTRQKAQLIL